MGQQREEDSAGPDPVWGVGLFVVGLLIMATGGAANWHIVFNVGEGIVLLGAAVFLGAVAITSHKLDPISLREVVLRAIGRDDEDEDEVEE